MANTICVWLKGFFIVCLIDSYLISTARDYGAVVCIQSKSVTVHLDELLPLLFNTWCDSNSRPKTSSCSRLRQDGLTVLSRKSVALASFVYEYNFISHADLPIDRFG
jgi:hypothetical protein